MRKLITLLALAIAPWASAQNTLVGYEYWFDEDHANRQWVAITSQPVVDITGNVPLSGLDLGIHYLRVRLRDTTGQWSSVLWRMFTIDPSGQVELVSLRYWSDQTQTPPANLIEVPFDDPAQYIDILDNLDLCTYDQSGTTRAFFQLKDGRSQWSSVIARDINIDVVGQAPQGSPAISYAPNNNGIEPNAEYVFTAAVIGGSSYAWNFPTGWTVVGQQGSTITVISPANPESGVVTVTPSNSCGTGADGSFLLSPTGVVEEAAASAFRLFPNPSNGQFTLALEGISGSVEVALFNMTGQQVATTHQRNAGNQITMDVGGLANGTYSVQWKAGERTGRTLLTVQH